MKRLFLALALAGALIASAGAQTTTTIGGLPANATPVPAYYTIVDDGSTTTWKVTLANLLSQFLTGAQLPIPLSGPQGRLTLTSGSPVMAADVSNAGTVFYDNFVGSLIPIYDGSTYWKMSSVGELTLTLNASHQVSGSVYDVFAANNAGTITLYTGPAWSSSTARGTGAGTTQLSLQNGLWLNTVAVTGWNSTSSFSIAAKQGTYLGTIYANGNAQVTWNIKPAGAVGGSANILGVYNGYNRVRIVSLERDTTTGSNQYAVNTWRAFSNSVANRITFVDGLQQSSIDATFVTLLGIPPSTSNGNPLIGIVLDSTSTTPVVVGNAFVTSTSTTPGEVDANGVAADSFAPLLGLHFAQAMQKSTSGGAVDFYANTFYSLRVAIEL